MHSTAYKQRQINNHLYLVRTTKVNVKNQSNGDLKWACFEARMPYFHKAMERLLDEEIQCLFCLIDVYYRTERPLAANLDELFDDIGDALPAVRGNIPGILKKFFTLTAAGYRNPFCDCALADYHAALKDREA